MRRGFFLQARDVYRSRLGAAQRERRSTHANHHRVAHRPHLRDDFAPRTVHEAEIAQSGQHDGTASASVIEARVLGEPGDDRNLSAPKFSERMGVSGWQIRRSHGREYGVWGLPM